MNSEATGGLTEEGISSGCFDIVKIVAGEGSPAGGRDARAAADRGRGGASRDGGRYDAREGGDGKRHSDARLIYTSTTVNLATCSTQCLSSFATLPGQG